MDGIRDYFKWRSHIHGGYILGLCAEVGDPTALLFSTLQCPDKTRMTALVSLGPQKLIKICPFFIFSCNWLYGMDCARIYLTRKLRNI